MQSTEESASDDVRKCPRCKKDFVVTVYDRPERCPHCKKFLTINHSYQVGITVGGTRLDIGFEGRELEAFCNILLQKGLSPASVLGALLKRFVA